MLEHSYNIASRLRRHQYDENLAHQFFCSVLPMHRATIQTVVIRKVKPGTLAWPITRAYLEGVCQCKNLESFYTYNDFPLDEDSGQVSTITLVCRKCLSYPLGSTPIRSLGRCPQHSIRQPSQTSKIGAAPSEHGSERRESCAQGVHPLDVFE